MTPRVSAGSRDSPEAAGANPGGEISVAPARSARVFVPRNARVPAQRSTSLSKFPDARFVNVSQMLSHPTEALDDSTKKYI